MRNKRFSRRLTIWVLLLLFVSGITFSTSFASSPQPDIKANGSDSAIDITTNDNLSITVELDSGSSSGEDADWWVVVNTPFSPPNDWYHYDLNSGWIPGLNVTYQGALFDLSPPFEVLNISALPPGPYTFYFGVDMIMNGSVDFGQLYYDSIEVNNATKMTLANIKYWAYNIQDVDTERQREELVGTHFDMYVLEPVVTEKGKESFDMASLIQDIRDHNIQTRNTDPLIIAYIDMGQAETWRWYYDDSWEIGNPEWIVGEDPDPWEGCYPVAYWHEDWENIVIYGYGAEGRSMVEESLIHGFDGIYMDWVEGFSDVNVIAKATTDGVDPATAMFDFIEKIRNYARNQSPNANAEYLVIAQNASDLYQEDSTRYRGLMDAIALEGIWYDGTGGFDDWDDNTGYNVRTNDLYEGYTEEVLGYLEPMKSHMPIFCVEYAQDMNGQERASEVYNTLAPAQGFIPYCSRRSLSRLSTTPYPAGYSPQDY